MNILILGGGGREHALAWAIRQNPKCDRLIVAPGNAGIAAVAECAELDILSPADVVEFAGANAVDLVVIGPEAPLAAGVSDALTEAGFAVFGPSRAAAMLEISKAFTKAICDAAGVPTAAWGRFTDAASARAHVAAQGAPIVVKADGLAAGKGVTVAMTEAEALEAIDAAFGGAFGEAGAELVIEEFMTGEEASFFVLCDGEVALPLGSAQDHKRVGEGDTGPNTGGMGAYSPAPVFTPEVEAQVMAEIIRPTLAELARRGTPYRGVLFAGLMIENGRARLVEYNARFGDPETQALMMRLGAQALDLIQAVAEGRLGEVRVTWADDHALTVVLAAQGYPGPVTRGSEIRGLEALPETSMQMLFHAGTVTEGGRVLANGGRVLAATGRGATLAEAQERAYAIADAVDWPEGFFRRDIGWRALGSTSASKPASELAHLPSLAMLAAWRRRLPVGPAGVWRGGEPGPDGIIQMPWLDPDPAVGAFVEAAYANDWVRVTDWTEWLERDANRALSRDPDAIRARATAEELFAILTVHIRGDRFSEGHLAEMVEAGVIEAVLDRAATLDAGREA